MERYYGHRRQRGGLGCDIDRVNSLGDCSVLRFAPGGLVRRRCRVLGAKRKSCHRHARLLRARRERPCRRCAAERYKLAASHCPMPPVLPTERIAQLGTADCCIHPPGRNEMIAITPPIIFSKEVAQNRPPHLPRQQPPLPPEIVSDQISGDGAWMNFRFSRALPPGGSHTPALTI